MRPLEECDQTPIQYPLPVLTHADVDAFRKATETVYSQGMPPTFPTVFRKAEWELLDRMEVDMRQLLHVDQEYLYHAPMQVGEIPHVKTMVSEIRERKGMYFVNILTEISAAGEKRISAITTFVLRPKP